MSWVLAWLFLASNTFCNHKIDRMCGQIAQNEQVAIQRQKEQAKLNVALLFQAAKEQQLQQRINQGLSICHQCLDSHRAQLEDGFCFQSKASKQLWCRIVVIGETDIVCAAAVSYQPS